MHSVQIVNGHNKMWMDRGVERFRVKTYSREGRVASAEGSFTGLTAARSALTVNLEAEKVTEIRVDVLSV